VEVVVRERVSDEKHVPGEQHGLNNPGERNTLSLEAQIVVA